MVARQLTTLHPNGVWKFPLLSVIWVVPGDDKIAGRSILIILIFVLPDLRMSELEARPAAAHRARLA